MRLNDAAPVRITGGSSYPASVPLQAAEMLLATREAQEGWLGNARDTVLVTAHASRADEITIHPGLVWLVSGGGSVQRIEQPSSARSSSWRVPCCRCGLRPV